MRALRYIAAILLVSIVTSFFSFTVLAEDTEVEVESTETVTEALTEPTLDAEESEPNVGMDEAVDDEIYVSSKNAGTVYSCVYDGKAKKIKISGSVTHDIFIKHRDYTVRLYKISPGEALASVINDAEAKPLASTAISIKFNFTADVNSVSDIFSQYVVVLVSNEGAIDYIGPQLYPSVESTYTPETDREHYKGVLVDGGTSVLQSEPSVAVVPVYLDRLISTGSTGYLHSLDGKNLFFDREYIDSLDRTVRSLSSSGSRVYFQLLLEKDANPILNSLAISSSAKYDIPDLYSAEVMGEIYAYCDFLSGRYSSYKNGHIDGMIIGKKLDDIKTYNNNAYKTEVEYTKALALYGIIVGVATRNNIPSADIAYSFTNANTYADGISEMTPYASSRMIENISRYFDEYYSNNFDFSLVLESSHRPLSITNELLEKGIDLTVINDGTLIVERNLDVFSDFLDKLDRKYSSAPESYMYVWSFDEELRGNALACAYSYLYYKFFAEDKLTSLIVDFENAPDALYDILNIVKYIDTEKGIDVTSQLLGFFGENSWMGVVYSFDTFDFATRKQELISVSDNGASMLGQFYYFDFSDTSSDFSWFAGGGCTGVSVDYSSVFGRSLCARFGVDGISPTDYAYILCSYEYPENFIFTPRLTFALSIEGERGISDIFEVKISFHSGSDVYELSQIVQTGKEKYVSFDLSDFSKNYMADTIRISVRPMSEASGEYTLCLSSIKGESAHLSDEELADSINAERMRIRDNSAVLDSSANGETSVLAIVSITVAAVILGVMLFVFLRRED